jgi:pyridinium-3,5-bisthiocarboxylic acid mononucleotide nickel chelatase
VLAHPHRVVTLRDLVLAETSTLGVREAGWTRTALPRGWRDVEVAGRPVAVKVAHRGGRVVQATPEFGDVADLADRAQQPARDVLAAAEAAAVVAGLVPGAPVPEALRPRADRAAATPPEG